MARKKSRRACVRTGKTTVCGRVVKMPKSKKKGRKKGRRKGKSRK